MSKNIRDYDQAIRLHWEVEQFLYKEADLLARRQFDEWLSLVDPEIRYAVPAREIRNAADLGKQFLPVNAGAHFDDDFHSLKARVKKLNNPRSWSENPPVFHRTFVTNVQVDAQGHKDLIQVKSNIMFTRTRLEQIYVPVIGFREDILKRSTSKDQFKLFRRTVFLDHAVLPGSGITTIL